MCLSEAPTPAWKESLPTTPTWCASVVLGAAASIGSCQQAACGQSVTSMTVSLALCVHSALVLTRSACPLAPLHTVAPPARVSAERLGVPDRLGKERAFLPIPVMGDCSRRHPKRCVRQAMVAIETGSASCAVTQFHYESLPSLCIGRCAVRPPLHLWIRYASCIYTYIASATSADCIVPVVCTAYPL